jgi:hemoglobin
MKKDIKNREDIILLINLFYEKVKSDKLISHFFTGAKVNWEKHLPVMYDFWENILFFTGAYTGQPMLVHQHLHQSTPLNLEHFKQWNTLFNESVDELFEGSEAENIKQKALSISTVMQIKILNAHNPI